MADLETYAKQVRKLADELWDEDERDFSQELHALAASMELRDRPKLRLAEFPENFE